MEVGDCESAAHHSKGAKQKTAHRQNDYSQSDYQVGSGRLRQEEKPILSTIAINKTRKGITVEEYGLFVSLLLE